MDFGPMGGTPPNLRQFEVNQDLISDKQVLREEGGSEELKKRAGCHPQSTENRCWICRRFCQREGGK